MQPIRKHYLPLALFILSILLISACSSDDKPTNPLWTPATYIYDAADKRVDLSLHYLDDVEDILQVDVMIQRKDGTGPLFEVQNAPVEPQADGLSFNWTDGFENQGTATIEALHDGQQSVRLHLKVEHIANERDMMFIDDYELKKQRPGATEEKKQTHNLEEKK